MRILYIHMNFQCLIYFAVFICMCVCVYCLFYAYALLNAYQRFRVAKKRFAFSLKSEGYHSCRIVESRETGIRGTMVKNKKKDEKKVSQAIIVKLDKRSWSMAMRRMSLGAHKNWVEQHFDHSLMLDLGPQEELEEPLSATFTS